jgi:DNA-binding MarR family transcriptional regulator
LGLVNSFIKRLVKKGYCKVTTIPKRRVKYLLTPSGAMEKTRLTYEYIATSYQYYKSATEKVQNLYSALENEGNTRVVFYGAGESAVIAMHAMAGTRIELVAVVDPQKKGNAFFDFVVGDHSLIQQQKFHVILVTMTDCHEAIIDKIGRLGVEANKVRFF